MHSMSEMMSILGNKLDNVIQEVGKSVSIQGWAGNDVLVIENSAGMSELWGGRGDDVLMGSVQGEGQIHMGGAEGNDHIVMDVTNDSGVQGHHVYGGKGADKFEFTNVSDANSPVIGRIDDFNFSEDSIWIEGAEIDLFNLPDGVELVSFQEQYFLKIGQNVIYALEGAREGGLERHFPDFPTSVDQLERVEFEPHVNFVPFQLFEDEVADLNALYTTYAGTVATTSGDDWIYDKQTTAYDDDGELLKTADAKIHAGDGNDVVEAGKGNDRVWGGDGDDLIAGGQDNDVLKGGNGNDRIWGGSESDKLYGNDGNDSLNGGQGNDYIVGGTGEDEIWGDAGDDRILGGANDDILYGGQGSDRLVGGRANDELWGGSENDFLWGGAGNDIISGGAGADRVNGGDGDDVFEVGDGDLVRWSDLTGGVVDRLKQLDEIQDFKVGSDTISFEGHGDVESIDDLRAWKTYQDDNVKFMLSITDTGERMVVDVEDDTEWDEFLDESNFSF